MQKLRKKMMDCLSVISSFVLFVLLGILIFILLVPKTHKEYFQEPGQRQSSRTLYQSSDNYESDLKSLFPMLSDNDDMLTMASCYQFPPNNRSMLPRDCLNVSATIYTSTFTDVRSKILSMLTELKQRDNGKNLKDPAYVLIEQAPFMRDDQGNVVTMQYSTRIYLFEPVNVMRTGASTADFNKPLFFRITIFLTNYYQNMSKRPSPLDIRMSLSPYRSKKDQCYISCIKDNTNSFCGCLNRDPVAGDNQSYASKCSSTPLPINGGQVDMSKNIEADFAILYAINTRASMLVSMNLFE